MPVKSTLSTLATGATVGSTIAVTPGSTPLESALAALISAAAVALFNFFTAQAQNRKHRQHIEELKTLQCPLVKQPDENKLQRRKTPLALERKPRE